MYGFLWRHLPGHWTVRIGELAVLAVGVLALLFYVVFPVVDPRLPFNNVTVQDGGSPSGAPSGASSSAPAGTASTPVSPAAVVPTLSGG